MNLQDTIEFFWEYYRIPKLLYLKSVYPVTVYKEYSPKYLTEEFQENDHDHFPSFLNEIDLDCITESIHGYPYKKWVIP